MAKVGIDTDPPDALASGQHDAFVSYSRVDEGFANELRRALIARGKHVWIDVDDLLGGADWKTYVTRAIETSKAFVFVLSPASLVSKQCREELAHALALNKLIVPVYHREFDHEELLPALASREWIFLRDTDSFDHGVAKLTEALETDLDWRTEHTRLAARAREWTDAGHDRSFLLRGAELRNAETWLARQEGHRERATPEQGRFVMESRRKATSRQRGFTGIAIAVAAGAVVLAGWALVQRHEARVQRHQAVVQRDAALSRGLAFQAEAKRDAAPDVAGLLSLEAYRAKHTDEARNAVLASIQALGARAGAFRCRGDYSESATLTLSSGRNVVCADANGLVDRWDATRLRHWGQPLHTAARAKGFRTGPAPVAISNNGARVAAVSRTGAIELWDIAKRRRLDVRFGERVHDVSDLAFSPDGKTLVVAQYNKTIRLWGLSRRGARGRLLARADASELTFSRAGNVLAWVDFGGGVEIWDWKRRRRLRRLQRNQELLHIVLDARGNRLATIDNSGNVRVVDVGSGKLVANPPTSDITDQIAISPQGDKLAYLSDYSGKVQLWSVPARGPIATDLSGSRGLVSALAFSPDGALLGALDGAGGVVLWHTDRAHMTDTILPVRRPGPYGSIDALAFSPDNRWLASTDTDGVELWDYRTGTRGKRLPGTPRGSEVVAFGNAKRLFVLGVVGVQSWRLEADRARRARRYRVGPRPAVGGQISDLELSAFGNELAYQLNDGKVVAQNLLTRRVRYSRLKRGALSVPAAFRADGREIAVAINSRVNRYSLANGAVQPGTFWHHFTVEALAYSPDGKTLATAPGDHSIHLWDLSHPGVRSKALIGHRDDVWGLAFSPDGKLLASASSDRTVRLWDLRTGRTLGAPLKGHSGQVFSLAFSHDGKTLASGSGDGTIRLWSSALWSDDPTSWRTHVCDAVRRNLSRAEWRTLIPGRPYHRTCVTR